MRVVMLKVIGGVSVILGFCEGFILLGTVLDHF